MGETKFLNHFERSGVTFAYGSDHHFTPRDHDPRRIAEAMRQENAADILILAGDLVKTREEKPNVAYVCSLIQELAQKYAWVVFAPGNHEYRHLGSSPWSKYSRLEKLHNVLMPEGMTPATEDIADDCSIAVANLFYDRTMMELSDLQLLGQPTGSDQTYYTNHFTDGPCLFDGDEQMHIDLAENVRDLWHERTDVDLLVTHVPPSPLAAYVRVPEETTRLRQRFVEELGMELLSDTAENQRVAQRHSGGDLKKLFYYSAHSAYFLGSNVLPDWSRQKTDEADPQAALECIYGHHHRSQLFNVSGVNFRSHQPLVHESEQGNSRG